MAKFTLTIDCDNDAFDDHGRNMEIARILDVEAAEIATHPTATAGTLRDVNGNRVGEWRITEADPVYEQRKAALVGRILRGEG